MQHYRPYQGRRPSNFRGFLKALLIVLILLLLLLLASTLLLQRYIVYGDDGIRLELPLSRQEEEEPPAPSAPVTPPPLIKEETPEEIPSPSPDLPEPIPMLHAVRVSDGALSAGTALTEMTAAGGDALVLTMKRDDGHLNYVSANELAVYLGSSAADPALNDAIRELTAADTYTVAQVSCFRDHRMSSILSQHKISTASGYCWEDHEQMRWISPADPEVCAYLTALCVELAELGFDEILLTHCGYPSADQGDLDRIRADEAYPAGMLDKVLDPFLAQVKAALEPYDVNLSVRSSAAELRGDTAHTGLTMEGVLAVCDRIWVDEADLTACYAAALAADPDCDPTRLIVSLQTAAGPADASWALWN